MNDLDERDDSPMPDPWTAMAWPVRLIVVTLIAASALAALFY